MAGVRVLYDRIGNTLTIWFDDPSKEYEAEETGDEIILMKDQGGNVIGFEKLNYSLSDPNNLQVVYETVPTPVT